ncbi:DUF7575 domain-containing protein [Halorubrum sp. DTA46]|uniref:DUF7575 domain-containing protein n=1 Tax=Halorubrum sp. DTA46 TaxID=3402162 RepID=UPI003AB0895E
MTDRSRRRPWLAAVLALVISGLGHAYLRRWARALGWYVLITATVVLLVPDAAVDSLFAGDRPPLIDLAPVLLVVAASVIDAYVLALRNNRAYERETADHNAPEGAAAVDVAAQKKTAEREAGANTLSSAATQETAPDAKNTADAATCPECGRDVDSELDFCQWCAAPLDE